MTPKIIDCHVHLITGSMINDSLERFESAYPGFAITIQKNAQRLFGDDLREHLATASLRQQADNWIKLMDENGIHRAIFFPISERLEEMRDFIRIAPKRFGGYAFLNHPASPDAPATLKKAVREYGLCGLKLYPSLQLFNPCDSALFPLYEEARSLGIPITFHFGITHAPVADYRYANPIELQLPLKLFPDLNLIIAHFGAGYFREVCLLGFHNKNVHLDTSGTNNWRDYTPERMPLFEVFKRAVEIYSAERILFGTDTVLRPAAGYRTAIMKEQAEIVKTLGISEAEQGLILGGNAERLFGG